MDVSFAIKELASSTACPTTGSLRKLGKLVGYLKVTVGQYSLLPYPDPGHGHATRTTASRWLLETFTDSDWSGAKGHRRSTSAAVHMVNGNVVLASSRGQKSVSLSSAEAELNALASGAADGIYLRRRLEFRCTLFGRQLSSVAFVSQEGPRQTSTHCWKIVVDSGHGCTRRS